MLNKKALGLAIKKQRKEKNMKQIDVSAKTDLSRNYISDIENGRYAPSVDALLKLAECIDLDLNLIKMTEIQVNELL
ncbi:helix-turn-helix domain-containing protein [Paenibacillus apiarius]|uniref:helix-turn-helix domain-containing protein n=1 Tax=Paenibacillus apiarius TaxID=46240 RepID=UPI003B3AD14D